jgi:hypothetical protein
MTERSVIALQCSQAVANRNQIMGGVFAATHAHEAKQCTALQSGGLGVANPMRMKLTHFFHWGAAPQWEICVPAAFLGFGKSQYPTCALPALTFSAKIFAWQKLSCLYLNR